GACLAPACRARQGQAADGAGGCRARPSGPGQPGSASRRPPRPGRRRRHAGRARAARPSRSRGGRMLNDIARMATAASVIKGERKGLTIAESRMTPAEREVVEDLIIAGHADAKVKAEELMARKMAKVTAGRPSPPGMKLPF